MAPGNSLFARALTAREMGSPEMAEKSGEGPVGFVNIIQNGPPAMDKSLGSGSLSVP
jgi:hypothetical protein